MSGLGARRTAALALVLGALVAGLIADRAVGRPPAGPISAASPAVPSQAPPGSLSSTWFCPPVGAAAPAPPPAPAAGAAPARGRTPTTAPAAPPSPGALADGRIVIANPTATDLTGTVTVIPSTGQPQDTPVRLQPRTRISLRLGDVIGAPYDAALVQLDGAGGGVEEQIRGPLGESTAPCATRASDHWYFASGSTERNSQLLLGVLNPFPADAIIDVDFATDQGHTTPADLQGLVVSGRSILVIAVGDHVRRRQAVSTTVAVRSGSVVASKIELLGDPTTPPTTGTKGATLVMGEPAPWTQWYFPDGVTTAGVNERYELYNPTDHEADVDVGLLLDRGSIDPFALTIAPHDRQTLVVSGESRVPPGVAHAGLLRSTNGVGFVAERILTSGPPSPHLGISDLTGSPSGSSHWLFPAGAANDQQDEWVVAFNPGATSVNVSVTALLSGDSVSVDGLQNIPLAPGQRVGLRLGDHLTRGDLILTVDAPAPIVVERDLYRVGTLGMSSSLGIAGP